MQAIATGYERGGRPAIQARFSRSTDLNKAFGLMDFPQILRSRMQHLM